MTVMVKRWYRSRRNQFITISIICIIYYICFNDNLPRDLDLDVTIRNARFPVHTNVSSSVVVQEVKIEDVYLKNRNASFPVHTNVSSSVVLKTVEIEDLYLKNRDIQREIEMALIEEKGSGCEMPPLDPFSKELMQFVKSYEPITCKGKDWVKCYLSECRVVDEILATTRNIVCTYQDIIHVSDSKYYLDKYKTVKGNKTYILDASDHVKMKCTGTHKTSLLSSTWVGYHLGFRKSVRRVPPPPDREDTINVLIFGFDSTAKNGFIRQMPKSYKYLKDQVKATILDGYNIVGAGTAAALFPILTGKNEIELPDFRKETGNNRSLDDMPFIFYNLTKDGYRTAYLEDMPWIGTFQYRYNGFQRQPVDHYLRSFYLEENKNGTKWGEARVYCVGDTPQFELMMNITDQFMSLDGKRFAFTFIADITHDATMISVADDAMVKFLQALEQKNVFEDTLLFVMGDHGSRFSTIRNTLQGKLEERLPLMAIRLPEKLKATRPNAQASLEANANVLTTPHDIHATILDALDWSEYINPFKINGADFPRSMSLLEPIPKNRSCSEAGIDPHWCACVSWKNVTDGEMIRKSADALITYVNELTESQRSKCAPRTLTEVIWMMRQRPYKKMFAFVSNNDSDSYHGKFGAQTKASQENYQLKVAVGPGKGIYEASMTYFQNKDKFVMNTRDISRINRYGTEPSCISATHPHLNPYCYCKDYVPPVTI